MIPERYRHRFEGDSGVDIATQDIDVVFPDNGERRRIVFRIGAPYPDEKHSGSYHIRVEIENLDRTDGPLSGANSIHALLVALSFVKARLGVFQEKYGCLYYWSGTEEMFDYKSYFSTDFETGTGQAENDN